MVGGCLGVDWVVCNGTPPFLRMRIFTLTLMYDRTERHVNVLDFIFRQLAIQMKNSAILDVKSEFHILSVDKAQCKINLMQR